MTDDADEMTIANQLGLGKLAPKIYDDLFQPAVKEFGKGLEITARAINLALTPIQGLVWGSEQIKSYLIATLTKRLRNIPPNQIVTPNPSVVGPAIEAFKFNGHNREMRELFANLISSSINAKNAHRTHPAFVEIIKQINPDEARILQHLAASDSYPRISRIQVTLGWWNEDKFKNLLNSVEGICEGIKLDNPELVPSYIDNLRRLQLIEMTYEEKDELPGIQHTTRTITDVNEKVNKIINARRRRIEDMEFTSLGRQFIEICISPDFSGE